MPLPNTQHFISMAYVDITHILFKSLFRCHSHIKFIRTHSLLEKKIDINSHLRRKNLERDRFLSLLPTAKISCKFWILSKFQLSNWSGLGSLSWKYGREMMGNYSWIWFQWMRHPRSTDLLWKTEGHEDSIMIRIHNDTKRSLNF